MKNKIIITAGSLMVLLFAFYSCTKEVRREIATENTDLSNRSYIQVYNSIINSARTFVYVDGSAVTGAALALGSSFPSTPSNASITSGFREFLVKDTLITSTQVPLSFGEVLQPGKYYTLFLYDSLTNAKKKLVENNIVIPSDTTARLRFANFIYSPTSIPNMDVFSKKLQANVFTNVPVTSVTDYIPFASVPNDTLLVRETGTLVQVAALNSYNPIQLRSYTVVLRGRYKATSPTTIVPALSSFSSN